MTLICILVLSYSYVAEADLRRDPSHNFVISFITAVLTDHFVFWLVRILVSYLYQVVDNELLTTI